jgi:biopolymer transport protein ExbD
MMVGERGARSCEINVTPLIDVLLVLLIIFMVILPEHKVGEPTLIPQPAPESAAKNPFEPIVIELKDVEFKGVESKDIQLADAGESRRPSLTINTQKIQWDELEARLKAIYTQRSDRVAFVKGDPEVEFAYVAEAVDIAHHAGADRIGLMGKKD